MKPNHTFKKTIQIIKAPELIGLFIMVVIFLVMGTVFYHLEEGWGWFDSLYFSAMTITTVGYGDLVPTSGLSKLFTMMYVFGGLGIVLAFVQSIARQSRHESILQRILGRAGETTDKS